MNLKHRRLWTRCLVTDMSNQIILATGNKGKLAEFKRMLEPFGYEVVSMGEAGFTGDIVEDGNTFAENALIKARTIHRAMGTTVVADDSGLCVDALGGRPGVYSARYLGHDTSYPEKIAGLLKELSGVPIEKRGAFFACAIALVLANGTEYVFEGRCDGVIGFAPRGGARIWV